jgi:hypothetical protein
MGWLSDPALQADEALQRNGTGQRLTVIIPPGPGAQPLSVWSLGWREVFANSGFSGPSLGENPESGEENAASPHPPLPGWGGAPPDSHLQGSKALLEPRKPTYNEHKRTPGSDRFGTRGNGLTVEGDPGEG